MIISTKILETVHLKIKLPNGNELLYMGISYNLLKHLSFHITKIQKISQVELLVVNSLVHLY